MGNKTKSGLSHFNPLERDSNRVPMQVPNNLQTQDETSTPVTSPVSYTAATLTLTIPQRAVAVHLRGTTDFRFSESSAMARYHLVDGAIDYTIPCAKLDALYITRDSANGTLYFWFELV